MCHDGFLLTSSALMISYLSPVNVISKAYHIRSRLSSVSSRNRTGLNQGHSLARHHIALDTVGKQVFATCPTGLQSVALLHELHPQVIATNGKSFCYLSSTLYRWHAMGLIMT